VLITNWAQFCLAFGDLVSPTVITAPPPTNPAPEPAPEGESSAAKSAAKSKTAKASSLADAEPTPPPVTQGHQHLAHAVYGFLNNGGSRCYVAYIASESSSTDLRDVLNAFGAIDDISIVCAPGATSSAVREEIIGHCEKLGDRFAILDGPSMAADVSNLGKPASEAGSLAPRKSSYAAWYFPWLQVFDPGTKLFTPTGDGLLDVPPSGHMAGIYARVDTARGVFKSPANEVVRGALGLTQAIGKADQDSLNPNGVNCIRALNGAITVWGARTVGGDANTDMKYISVRRTMLFLTESIDEGTQWAVFEPNTPALWQQLTRNVTAFLTSLWRAGALFGATEAEAFFVKCDAELNPPSERELGKVVMEIGVSIVRPAEFVIFRVSQFAAPGGQ
jgi:phage tail sheath protein FI